MHHDFYLNKKNCFLFICENYFSEVINMSFGLNNSNQLVSSFSENY